MSDIRLLSTYSEFDYSPETIKESIEKNDGKIMMKGILQKADTLNQNGRVYPLNILEREVRNYQKFILENRSLGELDHPDCVPCDDFILTQTGWKQIGEIANDEVIATINTKTNEIEYQRITEKIDQQYKGEMYVFKNARTYDMCLTPNHRILAWDRSQKPYFVTAKEAYDLKQKNDVKFSNSSLRKPNVITFAEKDEKQFSKMSLNSRSMKAEKIDYDGRVCCVKVPNGTWLMRHNGKSCWTGNSSVVNLKNVSHVIRELYIENGTVYGTLEVLHKTPSGAILKGLVESGIKLGISSRGVGSTQKKGDYHVVQDDFQLICFDTVSEPSTPQAFILPEGKRVHDFDLNKFLTRSDKIDRILNEILK